MNINVIITFDDMSVIKYDGLNEVDLKEGMLLVSTGTEVTMHSLTNILKVETEAVPQSFDDFDEEEPE